MNNYLHIIITRFNLPSRWNSDKQGRIVLDNAWLEERFNLFENLCLPSIHGQTQKNFEWWVYFDINTEEKFKNRIGVIEKEKGYFKPKFERSYDDFETNMPAEIYNYLSRKNIGWLITTRLDNDDMLAKDTVEIIQKRIDFKKNHLIEIPHGYTLELNNISKLRRLEGMLNPFISYVENIKTGKLVKSVYYYQHTDWKGVDSIIATQKPQWVQVIHENNVFNRALGDRVYPFKFKSRFQYNSEYFKIDNSFKLLTKTMMGYFKKYSPLKNSILKLKLLIK